MSGHTPADPVIERSVQLRERLAGMKTSVQRFATDLMQEIEVLETELDARRPGPAEGEGDDHDATGT